MRLSSAIASFSTASVSLTPCTSDFFFSAFAVLAVISWSSTADFSCATASVASTSFSSTFITSTSDAACSSFTNPELMFVASSRILFSFAEYTVWYCLMNARYDFGVTYA